MPFAGSTLSRLPICLAPLVVACAHGPGQPDLTRFARSASAVHQQVDASFAATNRVARDAAIDRFVSSCAVGLTEEPFQPVVSPEVAAAWDDALDGLERYATLMAALVDPGRGAAVSGAVTDLGSRLQSSRVGAQIDPGVGAGFAALAGLLVDASARSHGRELMMRSDPTVRALLLAMADAVGEDRASGLRGTVLSAWTTSLNRVRGAYALAAERREEARQRTLLADYLAGIDKREADLRALGALRASLVALADAHTAAAAGSAPTQQAVLDGIERRLDQTRASFDELAGGRRERR